MSYCFLRKVNFNAILAITILAHQLSAQIYSNYGVFYGNYYSEYQQYLQNSYANYGMSNELYNYNNEQLASLLTSDQYYLQSLEQGTVQSDDTAYIRNYLSVTSQKENKTSKTSQNSPIIQPHKVPPMKIKNEQENSSTQETRNLYQEIFEQGQHEKILEQSTQQDIVLQQNLFENQIIQQIQPLQEMQSTQQDKVPQQNFFENQITDQIQPLQEIQNLNSDNSNEEVGMYIPHKPKYIDEEEAAILQVSTSGTRTLSAAEITGIVVGCVMFLMLIAGLVGAVYFYLVRPNGQILCYSLLC